MPQYQSCVRCGSILPGSETSVGFEPPRAGRIEKFLRLASMIRTINRCGGALTAGIGGTGQRVASLLQLRARDANLAIFAVSWRGILPGFAQWYIGRKPHDRIFFFGWLISLFLAFLTLGRPIFGVFLGLAVTWHLCSIVDIVIITCRTYVDRIFLFSIMVIGAVLFFYIPTSIVWNHFGVQTLNADAGPLRSGDALLFTRSWNTIRPQVGEVVLYTAPQLRYQGTGHAVNQLGGNMFDRVLAVEGQTVAWQKGTLTINGEPPPYQPLVPVSKPPDATFVVPDGHCYIVPGVAFHRLYMPQSSSDWRTIGLVPNTSIYGVVWGVRRSLFHFVNIRTNNPSGDTVPGSQNTAPGTQR